MLVRLWASLAQHCPIWSGDLSVARARVTPLPFDPRWNMRRLSLIDGLVQLKNATFQMIVLIRRYIDFFLSSLRCSSVFK